ncbi:MAG TPA: PEGA domain-containing protein [Terriglobales bacterium]|nr:PEGA domain-containing protein [Terriglobales bacterium]
MNRLKSLRLLALLCTVLIAGIAFAGNAILGEVEIHGAGKVEKTSGVWVDGQYVGYVKELKGDRRLLLMPGDHIIVVRQSGYEDYKQPVLVEPGVTKEIHVKMIKDPRTHAPQVTAQVKLDVNPDRAAVFLDDGFVGHVHEFSGVGRAMLLSPGTHRIKIELPGYQAFETEISLLPNQKYTLKTDLAKGSIAQADALIKRN